MINKFQIRSYVKKIGRMLNIKKNNGLPSIVKYLQEEKPEPMPKMKKGEPTGNAWDYWRSQIVKEFNEKPLGFLRKPFISQALHPNQQQLAKKYLSNMQKYEFSRKFILPRLHDIAIGDPFLCDFFPLASPISFQHAWYMTLMQRHLGLFVADEELGSILEIGGGYGNFCRLVFSFGYSGKYIILDLPEMQSIQEHFLGYALPKKTIDEHVKFYSLSEAKLISYNKPSLLIATFSLNEMPMESRLEIENICNNFDYLFFAYNRLFDNIDNVAYFSELRERLADKFDFVSIKDDFRPAWFLLAKSKAKVHEG